MKTKNLQRIIMGTLLVLSIPAVAMVFTDEVNWGINDFIFIGVLLIGFGFASEFISSKMDAKYRPYIIAVTIAAILVIWVELAVGILD